MSPCLKIDDDTYWGRQKRTRRGNMEVEPKSVADEIMESVKKGAE